MPYLIIYIYIFKVFVYLYLFVTSFVGAIYKNVAWADFSLSNSSSACGTKAQLLKVNKKLKIKKLRNLKFKVNKKLKIKKLKIQG